MKGTAAKNHGVANTTTPSVEMTTNTLETYELRVLSNFSSIVYVSCHTIFTKSKIETSKLNRVSSGVKSRKKMGGFLFPLL